MATLVTENWSDRKIGKTAGGFRASRGFMVTGVTDEAAAIAAVVAEDPTTAYNATHPLSSWIYVDGQNADPLGVLAWKVTITYANNPAGRHANPDDPLAEPVRYRFEWCNTTESCDRDYQNYPIQNTALEAFSDSVPTDVLSGWLYAERNEPYYDAANAVAMSNTVNNSSCTFFSTWTLDKGQACCRRIIPMTPITSAATYVTVQYAIELRRGYVQDPDGFYDGFKIRILNAGRRGWYNNGGTATMGPIVEIINGQIQNVGSDVRLDNEGKPVDTHYKIGTTAAPGYATPIACPTGIPSSVQLENAGNAYFLKVFPQTMKLGDFSTLGL